MVPDFLTIAEAGALIGKRELSPVELTESRLARIERLDGQLHSFIRVLREPALAAARAAEAEIMAGNYRGPLKGLYMCGSSTHPGGGVTGLPGHNAAREILRDFRRRAV